jgi:DinB superfamily
MYWLRSRYFFQQRALVFHSLKIVYKNLLLAGISDLSIDELNKIPVGFNNNIFWNLGHLVASQQGLCYLRAGLKPMVNENIISAYKSRSKPEKSIDHNEPELIKDLLFALLDQFETDNRNNSFANYNPWTTRYRVEPATIDDSLNFLPGHEGLHKVNIMSLKRLVKK